MADLIGLQTLDPEQMAVLERQVEHALHGGFMQPRGNDGKRRGGRRLKGNGSRRTPPWIAGRLKRIMIPLL
jgi:hypothetical protein